MTRMLQLIGDRKWYLASLGLFCASCSSGGTTEEGICIGQFLPGDLVITEFMTNPEGKDEGKEWFEIYNASSTTANVSGLVLGAGKIEENLDSLHTMAEALIPPGTYFVVGGVLPEIKPAYVDYAYGAALGGLRNTTGKLALLCGETVVDQVTYEETKEGVSSSLNGLQVPDAVANDTSENWCGSKSEFLPGSTGTPGAKNDSCDGTITPGTCLDGAQERAPLAPAPGTVIITEFMANPEAVGDPNGEWLEVLVTQNMDLNGLQLGKTPGTVVTEIASPLCLPVLAGTHLVFAVKAESTENGGLPVVDNTLGFTIVNANGSLFVGYGGELLDSVTFTKTAAGASTALDPALTSTTANDDESSWCTGTVAYGAGDLGTPGAANGSCNFVPLGQCLAGGSPRPIVSPTVGDLVITEFMANPNGVGDTPGEWFEIYVGRDVDLNGLELGRAVGSSELILSAKECLRFTQGSNVLLAKDASADINGGLPPVDFTFSFSLLNSSSGLYLGLKGEVLDVITYTSVGNGVATSLDVTHRNVTDNDNFANWCPAVSEYGTAAVKDRGTPGVDNPPCP